MQTFKKILNYIFLIGIIGFLLWFSLSNIEVAEGESKADFLINAWGQADKLFLILSGFFALLSHFIRGLRWQIILNSMHYKTKAIDTFYSVMIGYFINLVIPRGGEVSRCYNMYKLDDVPNEVSIGSVIAERLIDLILLIGFIFASFLIEFDNLIYFIESLDIIESYKSINIIYPILILVCASIFSFMIVKFFMNSKNVKIISIRAKITEFIGGLKKGFLSVLNLESKGLFAFYSALIWILYYAMTMSVMYAFPETNHLTMYAAVSIFAIGGIAMAIPLPGGAGSYHTLVPLGLVLLYGLEQSKAVAFTFIYHGWQTFVIIVFGVLSLLISQYKIQKRKNANG